MSDDIKKEIEALRKEFYEVLKQRDAEVSRKIEAILKRYEDGEALIDEVITALKSFQGEREEALRKQERSLSHFRKLGKKKGTDH